MLPVIKPTFRIVNINSNFLYGDSNKVVREVEILVMSILLKKSEFQRIGFEESRSAVNFFFEYFIPNIFFIFQS